MIQLKQVKVALANTKYMILSEVYNSLNNLLKRGWLYR